MSRVALTGPAQIVAEIDQVREFGHICCDVPTCKRAWIYEVLLESAGPHRDLTSLLCRWHFGAVADADRVAEIVDCFYDFAQEQGWEAWWGDWRAA